MRRLATAGAAILVSTALLLALPPVGASAGQTRGHAHAIPAPAVFAPGVVSTEQEEYRITFTPDGRTAYFARSAVFFPFSRQATIMQTRRTATGWSEPVVATFSGRYPDLDPFVTSDGSQLYFSSIRPVGGEVRADADVWVVDRTPAGWSEPRHAGAVNETGTNAGGEPVDDLYPTVTPDGTLYVGSNRDGGVGGWDIYSARPAPGRTYGPARNLGPRINTAAWEFNPALTAHGRVLVFTRLAAFGPPLGELQASVRLGRHWTPPCALTAVNTGADEYHPSFSPAGGTLYFVRRGLTEDAQGDLYSIPTWAILARPLDC